MTVTRTRNYILLVMLGVLAIALVVAGLASAGQDPIAPEPVEPAAPREQLEVAPTEASDGLFENGATQQGQPEMLTPEQVEAVNAG